MCTNDSFFGPPTDIWACGITLFCFIFGTLPFVATNLREMFEVIAKKQLEIPFHANKTLIDLFDQILNKDPKLRITSDGIKKHPWMQQPPTNS